MLYLEIPDRVSELNVFLKEGHYSLGDLVDIILQHADGSEDSTEESDDSETDLFLN